MATTKGIRPAKSGLFWCNVYLCDNKLKLCTAKLIDQINDIWLLTSNGKRVRNDKTWEQAENKRDFHQKEVFGSEINEFFNFN